MKKLIITTVAILTVLTGGIGVVATQQGTKPVEDNKVSTNIQTPTDQAPVEDKPLEVVTTPMAPEAVAPPPAVEETPAPTPEAPAPVVVKSFRELIMDYPGMTDTPLKIECLMRIYNGWPERFQDHNRAANVALLGKKFLNPCSQLYQGVTLLAARPFPLMEDFGSGDWFVRNGAQ